jgi:hypothetical protein
MSYPESPATAPTLEGSIGFAGMSAAALFRAKCWSSGSTRSREREESGTAQTIRATSSSSPGPAPATLARRLVRRPFARSSERLTPCELEHRSIPFDSPNRRSGFREPEPPGRCGAGCAVIEMRRSGNSYRGPQRAAFKIWNSASSSFHWFVDRRDGRLLVFCGKQRERRLHERRRFGWSCYRRRIYKFGGNHRQRWLHGLGRSQYQRRIYKFGGDHR